MTGISLKTSTAAHAEYLMSWFTSRKSARQWGGPGLRYPFARDSFLQDIHWERMAAWSAIGDQDQQCAFGQYYGHSGYCRLARLAVHPNKRSSGVGNWFIGELMEIGMADVGTTGCSLFVLDDNLAARACYRKLGFVDHDWPQDYESNYRDGLHGA